MLTPPQHQGFCKRPHDIRLRLFDRHTNTTTLSNANDYTPPSCTPRGSLLATSGYSHITTCTGHRLALLNLISLTLCRVVLFLPHRRGRSQHILNLLVTTQELNLWVLCLVKQIFFHVLLLHPYLPLILGTSLYHVAVEICSPTSRVLFC